MLREIMISIDYANAIHQADKLIEIADDCSKIINSLNISADGLKNYWDGEAANAFIGKLDESRSEIIKIKNEINDTAALIKKVADAIKRADEEAAEVAKAGGGGSR